MMAILCLLGLTCAEKDKTTKAWNFDTTQNMQQSNRRKMPLLTNSADSSAGQPVERVGTQVWCHGSQGGLNGIANSWMAEQQQSGGGAMCMKMMTMNMITKETIKGDRGLCGGLMGHYHHCQHPASNAVWKMGDGDETILSLPYFVMCIFYILLLPVQKKKHSWACICFCPVCCIFFPNP